MIASLRRRHRRAFLLLAVVLPLLYALALFDREPEAIIDRLPAALATGGPPWE